MALDGYALLGGTTLTKMRLIAQTVDNLGQMYSRFIFFTNLTTHIIKSSPTLYQKLHQNSIKSIVKF